MTRQLALAGAVMMVGCTYVTGGRAGATLDRDGRAGLEIKGTFAAAVSFSRYEDDADLAKRDHYVGLMPSLTGLGVRYLVEDRTVGLFAEFGIPVGRTPARGDGPIVTGTLGGRLATLDGFSDFSPGFAASLAVLAVDHREVRDWRCFSLPRYRAGGLEVGADIAWHDGERRDTLFVGLAYYEVRYSAVIPFSGTCDRGKPEAPPPTVPPRPPPEEPPMAPPEQPPEAPPEPPA